MKNLLKKTLSGLLSVILLAIQLPAIVNAADEVVIMANGSTEYSIVYDADLPEDVMTELFDIANDIRYGDLKITAVETVSDTANKSPAAIAKEIVIGSTNRPGSKELASSLGKGEYTVKYDAASTRIFIAGGSSEDTVKALQYFFSTYIHSESKKLSIPADLNHTVTVDYVILSGNDLICNESSDILSEYVVYDFEHNKSYTRYDAIAGKAPRVVISQTATGINFAQYDYWVISYFGSQTSTTLPISLVVNLSSLKSVYPNYTLVNANKYLAGHPNAAASNGSWKTVMYQRKDFYYDSTQNCIVTPDVADQKFRFEPWYKLKSADGSYFGIEYMAFFKNKADAESFIEDTQKDIPVESLKIKYKGNETSSLTIKKENFIDLEFDVYPFDSFKNVSVESNNKSAVDIIDGRIKAIDEGNATLTFTANKDITGASKITKTVDVTVEGYKYDSILIDSVDIKNYKIVTPEGCDLYTKYAAELLADYILTNLNHSIEIVSDSTAETSYEILIGTTNRDESNTGVKLGKDEYVLVKNGTKIVMSSNGLYTTQSIAAFINDYLETSDSKNVNITTLPKTAAKKAAAGFDEKAENVIIMIGDGMGDNHINMAIANGLDSFVARDFPVHSRQITRHQSVINGTGSATDSSAAATAMATGYKSHKQYIGKDIYGNNVKNITELAYEKGAEIAVVTTDKITGATPAGFLVHNESRLDSAGIQKDIDALSASGFLDYQKGAAADSLAVHTAQALKKISENGSIFFAMIEESNTDAHTNSETDVTKAVTRFNDSIAYASQFAILHPNTAIIVTADHETGGIVADSSTASGYKFTTGNHTNRNVPIYAFGAGVEALADGPIENIEIARFMAKIYGEENFGQTEEVPIKNSGDVNADNSINTTDLVILTRYLANWKDYELLIQAEYCNIDGSASITTVDAVILARHLANWTGYESLPILP